MFLEENPIDVGWSDVSQTDTEVLLYKKVLQSQEKHRQYSYVHLISGEDLPLLRQDDIHNFLKNKNEQFIQLDFLPNLRKRLKYYHFFVKRRRYNMMIDTFRRLLLIPQLPFVDRLKNAPLRYAHGANWCSLTLDAVREIVAQYDNYRYMFTHTTCSDTHYKQMILFSSQQKFTFSDSGDMRFVIFDEPAPSPNTLSMAEYDDMIKSGCLFARKFKEQTEVFDVIYNMVCQSKHNQ